MRSQRGHRRGGCPLHALRKSRFQLRSEAAAAVSHAPCARRRLTPHAQLQVSFRARVKMLLAPKACFRAFMRAEVLSVGVRLRGRFSAASRFQRKGCSRFGGQSESCTFSQQVFRFRARCHYYAAALRLRCFSFYGFMFRSAADLKF